MILPKTKKEITQAVLNVLPEQNNKPIDQMMFAWWLTGRGGQGLRLSAEGLKAFEEALLEYYDFPLGLDTTGKLSIAPESFVSEIIKKIKCPYYLGITKVRHQEKHEGNTGAPFIRVYDHKTAMMMTLHGTLRSYLDSRI